MLNRDRQLSATGIRVFCEIGDQFGLTHEQCLSDTDLTYEALQDPELQPQVIDELRVVENIATGANSSVGIGIAAAKKMHVHVFGAWGFAILTSPTLRSAILTAIEYLKISFVLAEMHLDEDSEVSRVWFDLSDLPPAVRPIYAERHCAVTMTFIKELIGESMEGQFALETRVDDHEYAQELGALLDLDVIPDSEHYALVFSADLLERALPKSDPATLKFCLEQCEALASQMAASEHPWTDKVRDAILENIATEQKIDSIADALAVTERTLRRRLTEEGTNFRELYTRIRLSIAYELLESTGENVETVSWRVGYAEPASFVRAFSKRYGTTPGEIKKQSRT